MFKSFVFQLENDFLSGVISSNNLEGLHTAGRGRRIAENSVIWSWDDSNAPFSFTKWSPGRSWEMMAML